MKDAVRKLCDFLIQVTNYKDHSEMVDVCIQQYEDEIKLEETLSLWKGTYCISPLIQEFNKRTLLLAPIKVIHLFIPQLVFSIKENKNNEIVQVLLDKCQESDQLSIAFFWTIVVEIERHYVLEYYNKVLYKFLQVLNKSNSELRSTLKRQSVLVEKLVYISGVIRSSRLKNVEKTKLLQTTLLQDKELLLFDPLLVPTCVEPVIGIVPEECKVFASQLSPMLLTFLTKSGKMTKTIFKSGDDLRQDAIILQTTGVMNSILKENKVNAQALTYQVVSTGLQHGLVEYVPSYSFDELIQTGLDPFFRNYGLLSTSKMNNFIASTACSSVFTFLLCVGDRHLDNILLKQDGTLFHIDYSFIGRETKPFSTAMKLCPEMVSLMGGKHSGYYLRFIELTKEVYKLLRRHHLRIFDGLELATDSSIPDLTTLTLEKMRLRYRLDLSEADASKYLETEIERGFETVVPKLMDSFHHTWKSIW